MTKNIMIAFAATLMLGACNDSDKTKTDSTLHTSHDSSSQNSATTTTSYTPVDGDVKYSGNKVMVLRNGNWVQADADVKLENGVIVYKNGRVERDGYEIELQDGEVVNKTGDFFDRTGSAIANAWDATKEGTKDAGRAVKKGFNKVEEKVEKAFGGDGVKDSSN